MRLRYLINKKKICFCFIILINNIVAFQLGKLSEKRPFNIVEDTQQTDTSKNIEESSKTSECPSYIVRRYDVPLDSEEHVSIPILNIVYMPDEEIKEKARTSIQSCFVEWLPVNVFKDAVLEGAYAMLDTDEYLSIENQYMIVKADDWWYVKISNTIDMETGEVVYLSDLVEINMEFVDVIMREGIVKLDVPSPMSETTYYTSEMLNGIDEKEVLSNLKMCSIPYDADNYFTKPAFYLRENRPYLSNIFNIGSCIYVELDDIEEFLLVEKW